MKYTSINFENYEFDMIEYDENTISFTFKKIGGEEIEAEIDTWKFELWLKKQGLFSWTFDNIFDDNFAGKSAGEYESFSDYYDVNNKNVTHKEILTYYLINQKELVNL